MLFHRPSELKEPTLILAYSGWNDAGEAATMAVRHLIDGLDATPFARIETEEFLDFTVARPRVRLARGGAREIVWPDHELAGVRTGEGDLILGLGIEPHLRWKSYCRVVVELVRSTGVNLVVLAGAYLADVIYSQPIRVGGFSSDPVLAERFGLGPSSYEGPTGIVGVLSDALHREGVRTLGIWASLPHYVSVTPNARGALALLQSLEPLIGVPLDLSSLESEAGEFDDRVSQLIAGDPSLTAYVRELKRRAFSQ